MIRACSRSRLRNPGAANGTAFNPLSLFTAGEQGAWYDPSDMTSLFQDDAGTVPVTAADQVVGMMRDKSGNAHHATQATEASKPILRTGAGLWWLEFDGVDDFMVTGSINFTTTDKMSLFAGVRKLSDAAIGLIAELSATINSNNGSFSLMAPTGVGSPNWRTQFKGTIISNTMSSAIYPAPITNILSSQCGIGVSQNFRVSGTLFTGDGLQGTGSFGNYPLYLGRRGGTTLPFSGLVYGLIVRGLLSDSITVAGAESFMATKSGVIL